MTTFKKKNLDKLVLEFIDSELSLIGYNAEPSNDSQGISAGTQPTDYNARIAHQNFKDDFLSRFGFWQFNETEEKFNSLKADLAKLFYDADMKLHDNMDSTKQFSELTEEQAKIYNGFADRALQICRKHIKELVKGAKNKPVEKSDDITESDLRKMVEDKLAKKTDGSIAAKKTDSDVLPDTVKKISGLVSRLSKEDRDVLMKHLK